MSQPPKPMVPVLSELGGAPRPSGSPCPQCLTAYRAGARFCPFCGNALTEPPDMTGAARPMQVPSQPAAIPVPSTTPAGEVTGPGAGEAPQPPVQAPPPAQPPAPACPNGHTVPADAQYCPQCGKQVEETGEPSYRLSGRSTSGKQYSVPLAGSEITIGKTAECSVAVPEDDYLSRRHAKISMKDGQFVLEDLGSANGTFLKVRRAVPLEPGDEVLVGTSLFRLEK